MQTHIVKINPKKINHKKINLAAEIIKSGKLVAFPTETVYGLGANALDKNAVKKIYKAKGRPSDNPLIIHINDKKDLAKLTLNISKDAQKLIDKFWPGPLTLIFKKTTLVPKETTAGIDTVAIRMPQNSIALALIKASGFPIAAPSANLFSKPSPTSAKHVSDDLNGKIEMIIDGGNSQIGLESTVVDTTEKFPIILRPGGITKEELKKIIPNITLHPAVENKKIKINKLKSPGLKYKHYAPKAKIIFIEKKGKIIPKIKKILQENTDQKIAIILTNSKCNFPNQYVKFIGNDPKIIARNLFKLFRKMDDIKMDLIIIEGIDAKNLGLAIINRIKRATYKVI